ncbi:MAG TPA: DUF6717 family protein [Flavisolibacter sp.]|nr:DUF6717 family protein [Flavisolibacter sp.]
MYTIIFYKLGASWFLDFPEYLEQGGDPENLERIGTFHENLELISKGKSTLIFQMDFKPFEGADEMHLTGSSGGKTGGYYQVTNYKGNPVKIELWINSVIYGYSEELPRVIYFK